MPRPPMSPEAFWSRVDCSGDCWAWMGMRSGEGYGRVWVDGRRISAQRLAWTYSRGPIPPGVFVCHTCDNPPCVRPDHLFLGTARDNALDMVAKGRSTTGDRNGARLHPKNRARGERHGLAKLSELEVRAIRRAVSTGAGQRTVAREMGLSTSTVHDVVTRHTWSHVP